MYIRAALLMAGILLCSVVLTAITGVQIPQTFDGLQVTASFYPMYVATAKVVGDVDGVTLHCLAQPQNGCTHNYSMSANEMLLLQQTDVLVCNGAGAEAFLQSALKTRPDLVQVDASKGISLLREEEHYGHSHQHDHQEIYNEHIWMSPLRYMLQVRNIADGLAQADPAHAEQYAANAAVYCREIQEVWEQMQTAVEQSGYQKCVIFSSSLLYLVQDLGLQVLGALTVGEESEGDAAELAQIQKAVEGQKVLFLCDTQYDEMYSYLRQAASQSYLLSIDTAVQGQLSAQAWLKAMNQTLEKLQALSN